MERVAFLVEATNDRIACMLNPESLILRRRSGVRTQTTTGGLTSDAYLADDPIFFTGGGTTELTLDLLFDTQMVEGQTSVVDVRELTGPLWQLAENGHRTGSDWCPAQVLFFWGKAWAIPGVIVAVAERLDDFTRGGTPRRSWLRVRMLRVAEHDADLTGGALPPPRIDADALMLPPPPLEEGPTAVHELQGDGTHIEGRAISNDRLDQLAHSYYGDASQWRTLAWLNDVANPLRMFAGTAMQVAADWDMESTR